MSNKVPEGFVKIETSIAGFWKPEKPGQTVQGTIGESVTVKGKDDKDNTFHTMHLTTAEGGPIVTSDDKPIKPEIGMMVGVGGKMLAIFLRGREGREVFIMYAGLGKKKPGQNAPKLFETYEKLPEY